MILVMDSTRNRGPEFLAFPKHLIFRLRNAPDCCSLACNSRTDSRGSNGQEHRIETRSQGQSAQICSGPKRKAELLTTPLIEEVQRAAKSPIQYCLLSEGLLECGMGTLVLARGATMEYFKAGIFLLDTFCLRIKDVMFRSMTEEQLALFISRMSSTAPLTAIEPSTARKLLRELAAWARGLGFAPAQDFVVVEQLFGEVSAETCETSFQFGHEGKPLYIGDLSDETVWRRRVA
jgi:hypothetical protein